MLLNLLTLLPAAGRILYKNRCFSAPVAAKDLSLTSSKPMPDLHRDAFVMDGHTHVMSRELILKTDIGQRYPDGTVDLPRAKEGGLGCDVLFGLYA